MHNSSPSPTSLWSDTLGRAGIRSAQTLLVLALASTVIWALTRVPLVITPVVIALILASAMSPIIRRLVALGWPTAAATAVSFVGIIAVVIGVLAGASALVSRQWHDLVTKAMTGIDSLRAFLADGPVPISEDQIMAAQSAAKNFLLSPTFGTEALTGVKVMSELVVGALMMAVLLFFFLKDGPVIRAFLISFLPARHRGLAGTLAERSTLVLGGYVRGTAIVAAVDGLVVGIALAIMGVPLALPLGVFIFIGGFIPIVGATAAGSAAVLVALVSNGPTGALIVLAVVIGANQLEHHFLQPVLMGKVLNIHGVVILLALAAGTMLAGVIGALLAVPITAVGWTVLKTIRERDAHGEPAPDDEGRTEPAVLEEVPVG